MDDDAKTVAQKIRSKTSTVCIIGLGLGMVVRGSTRLLGYHTKVRSQAAVQIALEV